MYCAVENNNFHKKIKRGPKKVMVRKGRPPPIILGGFSRKVSSSTEDHPSATIKTPYSKEDPFTPENRSTKRTEIIHNEVYLGSNEDARNSTFIKNNNIKSIITLNNTILPKSIQNQVDWLKLPIPDLPDSNMIPIIFKCLSFMMDCRMNNKPVCTQRKHLPVCKIQK